jgi:hypothetical protein
MRAESSVGEVPQSQEEIPGSVWIEDGPFEEEVRIALGEGASILVEEAALSLGEVALCPEGRPGFVWVYGEPPVEVASIRTAEAGLSLG